MRTLLFVPDVDVRMPEMMRIINTKKIKGNEIQTPQMVFALWCG